uniref:ATP synthase subunit a n=2 Tax=Schizophyllum commune TaxID=5334 RepID=Q94ZJ9_SCHCO|nr:ATP synthase F0 subunit 6 [Schizophyllum commune]AAK83398.1 ATP synthase F0 subunit 6 [Schizophyllum commune]
MTYNMLFSNDYVILSPLNQFEVTNLIGLNIPFMNIVNFSFTNLSLYTCLVLVVIIGLHFYGLNDTFLIPNNWSITLESFYASLSNMVREQISKTSEVYIPFIYSLFFFILTANLISNVPYSFAVTASAVVSLGLSMTIFIGVTILALSIHKIKFFSFFVPGGTPIALVPLLVLIEFVSYFARSLSLGIRLFANLFAGHVLLAILSSFLYKLFSSGILVAILTLIPFALMIGIIGLELAVSFIQAFVFTILTCSYLKDAILLH